MWIRACRSPAISNPSDERSLRAIPEAARKAVVYDARLRPAQGQARNEQNSMTSQDHDPADAQPQETPSAENVPAKPTKQNIPWHQTLKGHDRGQRLHPPPRGSRRSMGKR